MGSGIGKGLTYHPAHSTSATVSATRTASDPTSWRVGGFIGAILHCADFRAIAHRHNMREIRVLRT